MSCFHRNFNMFNSSLFTYLGKMKWFTQQWLLNLTCPFPVFEFRGGHGHCLKSGDGKWWWHKNYPKELFGWSKGLRESTGEVFQWEESMNTSIIVFVCSGCCNKNTIDWWVYKEENLPVTVLETGKSNIKVLEDSVSGSQTSVFSL